MGWSAWQTGDTTALPWKASALIGTQFDHNTGEGYNTQVSLLTGNPDYATIAWLAEDPDPGAAPPRLAYGTQRAGVELRADLTYRAPLPDLLFGLPSGAYGIRPDRVAGDPDAYVQYDEGIGVTVLSTAMNPAVINGTSNYGPMPFHYGITVDTNLNVGSGWPGIGTVLVSGDLSVDAFPQEVEYPLEVLIPAGSGTSFTFAGELLGDEPEAIPGGQQTSSLTIVTPFITTTFRQPPWRYWIPETAPVDVETRPLGWKLAPTPNAAGGPDNVNVDFGSW